MIPSNEKAAGGGVGELQTVAYRFENGIRVDLVRRTDAESALKLQADRIAELEGALPRWVSPKDEMPPPLTTVPTLSHEKRSTTGWAHSYGSWSDDPDDNSRPDSKMFKARIELWCKLPELPPNPRAALSKTA